MPYRNYIYGYQYFTEKLFSGNASDFSWLYKSWKMATSANDIVPL